MSAYKQGLRPLDSGMVLQECSASQTDPPEQTRAWEGRAGESLHLPQQSPSSQKAPHLTLATMLHPGLHCSG